MLPSFWCKLSSLSKRGYNICSNDLEETQRGNVLKILKGHANAGMTFGHHFPLASWQVGKLSPRSQNLRHPSGRWLNHSKPAPLAVKIEGSQAFHRIPVSGSEALALSQTESQEMLLQERLDPCDCRALSRSVAEGFRACAWLSFCLLLSSSASSCLLFKATRRAGWPQY